MRFFMVTHGDLEEGGFNPRMTRAGREQIKRILDLLPTIPRPDLVMLGTGSRFVEAYDILETGLHGALVIVTPFCGNADALEQDGTVATASGKWAREAYVGLAETCGFFAWDFLTYQAKKMRANTVLICAGGELAQALGHRTEKGQLYELYPTTGSWRKIQTPETVTV